jgi:hypothetical protein
MSPCRRLNPVGRGTQRYSLWMAECDCSRGATFPICGWPSRHTSRLSGHNFAKCGAPGARFERRRSRYRATLRGGFDRAPRSVARSLLLARESRPVQPGATQSNPAQPSPTRRNPVRRLASTWRQERHQPLKKMSRWPPQDPRTTVRKNVIARYGNVLLCSLVLLASRGRAARQDTAHREHRTNQPTPAWVWNFIRLRQSGREDVRWLTRRRTKNT